uniref:LytTR family DNA-binding domain-containing protein n=1 Tax=Minwuia sp. TaxID=2493630 RepID=UPI003A911B6A
YWGFMIIVNWLQLRLCNVLLHRWLGEQRFWTAVLGACLIASVPATFEVIWLEGHFRPELDGELGFFFLYPQVLTLSTAIMVPISYFFLRQNPDTTKTTPASTGSAFMKRIPVALGTDLHALQAEDHYIRVYTAQGDDLILHRFSDAMIELENLDGLRVHRSWWVARAGLADVARHDRKVFLVLKNGTEVPVSRTYMPAVRDAGWLA